MHLAIGHKDRPGNPVSRHIGHQAFQRAIKVGAIIARIGFKYPHFQRGVGLQLCFQVIERCLGRARAISELHAFRPVEHDGPN